MVQGITESGKVVYVTAIFPYVVLIIFFFRGITLKGASDGLMHLFTPRWERLADPVVRIFVNMTTCEIFDMIFEF